MQIEGSVLGAWESSLNFQLMSTSQKMSELAFSIHACIDIPHNEDDSLTQAIWKFFLFLFSTFALFPHI